MNNTLDSQQLRVFVVLTRTLNMPLAASELGVTVSGVSHCLKALETNLGCRLVDRNPRGLALSPAGQLFLTEARHILDQMESARTKVRSWVAPAQTHLTIAATGSACRSLLPPALREFRESFPDYTINLQSAIPRDAHGTGPSPYPDLIFTPDPSTTSSLTEVAIGEDDLLFFAHPLHPWVTQRRVDREDLAQRRLILPERGTPTFARISQYFQEEKIQLRSFIEAADEGAIEELIRLDLGVGILPRWVGAESVTRGALAALPLGRRRLKRTWFALHPRGRSLSLAESLLISLCRSLLKGLSPATAE